MSDVFSQVAAGSVTTRLESGSALRRALVARIWAALLIAVPVTNVSLAQPSGVAAMESLSRSDSLHAARLSRAEFRQVIEQLELTSFDEPKSWEKEIRVRRVHLGVADGLIVQGTNLLCGATGNCKLGCFGDGGRPGFRCSGVMLH